MRRLLWVLSLLLAITAQGAGKPAKKAKPAPPPPPVAEPAPAPEPTPVAPPAPAPPPAPRRFTVGLNTLSAVSISAEEAALHSDILAQRLAGHGLKVLTSSDMATVLGFERQKALLGCTDSGCLAELGAALGFDGLVVGTVGKVDGLYSLAVRVLKPGDATTVAAWSKQGLSAKNLELALARAAWELTAALAAMPGSTVARPGGAPPELLVEAPPARIPWRPLAVIPGLLGLGGVGAGVYLHLQAGAAWGQLNAPGITQAKADTALKNGLDAQNAERACFAVGGTLVAAAVVMFAVGGGGEAVTPVAWVDGHGAMVGLAGALP